MDIVVSEAAAAYDGDGRLMAYRAWSPEGPVWHSINDILMGVADMLRSIPPTFKNGRRGDFSAYLFSLHRGSQVVRPMPMPPSLSI